MSVLARLQTFLGGEAEGEEPRELPEADLNLACAALLVEVARADYADDEREREATTKAIREVLEVEAGLVEELMAAAETEVTEGTSMFPHTQLINANCSRGQKYEILKAMWRVAFADGNLDKYEEHLIRRVAGLIHVDHSDFIHAKIEARDGSS
ncbi:MAG: hypothetical protein CMO74_03085 [Verrucomicrobiales bacterium]|nr:hypothetical protein [Verrucomicrobiales bacterium]|tara:strand:+ start:183 stop:644 length:462 start_codon:yes stop_codon:yes gene_type:complete